MDANVSGDKMNPEKHAEFLRGFEYNFVWGKTVFKLWELQASYFLEYV